MNLITISIIFVSLCSLITGQNPTVHKIETYSRSRRGDRTTYHNTPDDHPGPPELKVLNPINRRNRNSTAYMRRAEAAKQQKLLNPDSYPRYQAHEPADQKAGKGKDRFQLKGIHDYWYIPPEKKLQSPGYPLRNGSLIPRHGNQRLGGLDYLRAQKLLMTTARPQNSAEMDWPEFNQNSMDTLRKLYNTSTAPAPNHQNQTLEQTQMKVHRMFLVQQHMKNNVEFERQKYKILQSQERFNRRHPNGPRSNSMRKKQIELIKSNNVTDMEDIIGVRCLFNRTCPWVWEDDDKKDDTFKVISGEDLYQSNLSEILTGPFADASKNNTGEFLYARLFSSTEQINISSPVFPPSQKTCEIHWVMHQGHLQYSTVQVVLDSVDFPVTTTVIAKLEGNNLNKWENYTVKVGAFPMEFKMYIEVESHIPDGDFGHIAIDSVEMKNCFPKFEINKTCDINELKCKKNNDDVCMPLSRICDMVRDCDNNEDEELNCHLIPLGGRCNFESTTIETQWCGFYDPEVSVLQWSRFQGAAPTHYTGPFVDHTYLNESGHYMVVNMNQKTRSFTKKQTVGFASNAVMYSRIFNPPPILHGLADHPFTNSCIVRFYYHQFGRYPGAINVSLVELGEKENTTHSIFWSYKNKGENWHRFEAPLPNVTTRYLFALEAKKGLRIYSDIAIDDFSLSPQCFGLNIPKLYLGDYNYYNYLAPPNTTSHTEFENLTFWEISACGARGWQGPTPGQCDEYYRANNMSYMLSSLKIIENGSYKGMQKWRVPSDGIFTVIVKGAGGGVGPSGMGSSRGSVATAILELEKDEELYLLIGQQGENACISEEGCDLAYHNYSKTKGSNQTKLYVSGGGGGASFVFLLNSAKKEAIPLIIAGAGGGVGIGQYLDENFHHGQGVVNFNEIGVSGQVGGIFNEHSSPGGSGGGWKARQDVALSPINGAALLQGGRGGTACNTTTNDNGSPNTLISQGGFGGGGAGCLTGGAGGGFSGGDINSTMSNGQGGSSYFNPSSHMIGVFHVEEGVNSGPGEVIIIPAIIGCGCEYRCVAMDEFRAYTQCICPNGTEVDPRNVTSCRTKDPLWDNTHIWTIIFATTSLLLSIVVCMSFFFLYQHYQRKKQADIRTKIILQQEIQLEKLRNNQPNMLTNTNPNYGRCEVVQSCLRTIDRDALRVLYPIGNGCFGKVYKGFYRLPKVKVQTVQDLANSAVEDAVVKAVEEAVDNADPFADSSEVAEAVATAVEHFVETGIGNGVRTAAGTRVKTAVENRKKARENGDIMETQFDITNDDDFKARRKSAGDASTEVTENSLTVDIPEKRGDSAMEIRETNEVSSIRNERVPEAVYNSSYGHQMRSRIQCETPLVNGIHSMMGMDYEIPIENGIDNELELETETADTADNGSEASSDSSEATGVNETDATNEIAALSHFGAAISASGKILLPLVPNPFDKDEEDAGEIAVAVKSLPEFATKQSESDFLMEANIMSKFDHANIIQLYGICFDCHPRYLVIELLPGGDLRNFLRDERLDPGVYNLTMKDLVLAAIDVARGCAYLEKNKFVHRDIAARNCLLSTKNEGRVVKIADFGMARDIFRNDYYKKNGSAVLPIKWMPPEAFLDGIFTSKTDVYSYGILLWEIFSLAIVPYSGLQNSEVMALVANGGRMDRPEDCPRPIFDLMVKCWNQTAKKRPTFAKILALLEAITQYTNILNAPLPKLTFMPPSPEDDGRRKRPPRECPPDIEPIVWQNYLEPFPKSSRPIHKPISGTNNLVFKVPPVVVSPTIPANQLPPNCEDEISDQQLASRTNSLQLPRTSSTTNMNNNNNHSNNNNSTKRSNSVKDDGLTLNAAKLLNVRNNRYANVPVEETADQESMANHCNDDDKDVLFKKSNGNTSKLYPETTC